MNNKEIKEKIKHSFTLAKSFYKNLSPNQAKVVGTMATAPIIAAATMEGACAGGCPYGLSYDPYPGQCPRYIDASGSGSCDLAVSAASTTQPTSSDSSSSDSVSQDTTTDSQSSVDNSTNVTDHQEGVNATAMQDTGTGGLDGAADGSNFHILPVTIILIGAYLFTYYLFKSGILKAKQHKRIWNILVSVGYLGTGITGVLLTVMINLGISTAYNPGITYWHAELALLMVLGTFIHIHIYRRSFKKMFKVLFGFPSSKKKKNLSDASGVSK